MQWPYLTESFDGIGGQLKERPEDFVVRELPLYEPSGEGEHVYVEITKKGMTTFTAIDRIAEELGISSRNIGYAGMKDARAVTTQRLSIFGATPEAIMALKISDLVIHWAVRHVNKLRIGHLEGNQFTIKIRQVEPTAAVKLAPVLKTIQERGLPNYFGEQRFGQRGNNHLLGAAVVRWDAKDLLSNLLGKPDFDVDDSQTLGARKAFDSGNLQLAMKLFPRRSGMERRMLARYAKTGKAGQAAKMAPERLRRIWTSALQSHLFNLVLAKRIETIDQVWLGDVAMKLENGSCFHVEDLAAEQARCQAFEISPTGPLVGYRVTLPTGEALKIEEDIFAEMNLKPADFRNENGEKIKGNRRALRVKVEGMEMGSGVDEKGSHVTLSFTLPAGSFATVLLRELMKPERHAEVGEDVSDMLDGNAESDDVDDSDDAMLEE